MALIIEDGNIIDNANSYITVIEARAFATARGITLSVTDSVIDILAIKAMDYLESLRNEYQGTKVDETQCLQFPREEVYIDGILQSDILIPVLLKKAQCQLMLEINAGINIMPTKTTSSKKRTKVGPIETEYFSPASIYPSMPAFEAFINPLLKFNSVGMIPVIRA